MGKLNIFRYYIANQLKEVQRINLLLVSEHVDEDIGKSSDEEVIDEKYGPDAYYSEPQKETKYHYCWIKNLNRLLDDQNKQRKNIFL